MKKRIIAVLGIVTLVAAVLAATLISSYAAGDKTAYITVGSNTYKAEVGSYVEYDLSFKYSGKKLSTAQAELQVDFSAMSGYTQAELDGKLDSVAPYTASSSVVLRSEKGGKLDLDGYVMNFANPNGFDFSSSKVVLTLKFKVEKAGKYTLGAKLRYIEDIDGKVVADDGYNIIDSGFSYTESLEPTELPAPRLTATNDVDGLLVRWGKVKDAAAYRVFRKSGSSWVKLADTEDDSYLDKTVTDGSKYTYTVACLSTDRSHTTGDYTSGKTIVYHAAPKPTVINGEDAVKLSWTATKGAAKYSVYYDDNGNWTKLTEVTGTSCTDSTVESGQSRTYTVRSVSSDNQYMSAYYPGVTIEFHSAPTVSLSLAANGVNVRWPNVPGAVKYRVYSYVNKTWTKICDTESNSYLDTNVQSNTSYTYTVRCINEDGTAHTSDYRAGVSIKYYAAPKLTLSAASSGVSIKWNSISGASKYRLYYMTSDGWKKITDTASTSYVDTSIKKGETRTYTIRAMDANGNHLSWYYQEGFTITY